MKRAATKCWGVFTRRERWGLSWRGRAIILLAGLFIVWVIVRDAHAFLAVTARVPAKILVVEGWVHDYGVDAALKEFNDGHYSQIYATGGPVEGIGPSSSIYDTEARRTALLLVKRGLPAESVQCVPAVYVGRDRTFTSALALHHWFHDRSMHVGSINVLTEDAHARRTWLLFQEAMGPDTKVGIISAANPDYDASHWWRTSEGVREVIDESIAYVYGKFFFWPSAAERK